MIVLAASAFVLSAVMALGTFLGLAPLPPRRVVGALWAVAAAANFGILIRSVS